MGIPSTMRDAWANGRNSPLIASPLEDQKILISRQCTQEGVRAGVKAASVACVATAVPTLVAVRVLPWAKANLNYTAQALIISAEFISDMVLLKDRFQKDASKYFYKCNTNFFILVLRKSEHFLTVRGLYLKLKNKGEAHFMLAN
ncbi:hypothetical protein RHSIM_Rhsim07G0145300 [Rhododendron simsii]|uniref:Uncharacterized protein n=1 Tax=Rhododendron simsii TaxID=118357 RepID=A0A834GLU2_RHOSS|nr:hypothetical protein RHSIM_Rhsim07G0145300 [Rhododendron simsii]